MCLALQIYAYSLGVALFCALHPSSMEFREAYFVCMHSLVFSILLGLHPSVLCVRWCIWFRVFIKYPELFFFLIVTKTNDYLVAQRFKTTIVQCMSDEATFLFLKIEWKKICLFWIICVAVSCSDSESDFRCLLSWY